MASTSTVLSSGSGNVVTVTIYLDGKGEIQVDPARPFEIFKSKHQQVLWRAGAGISHFNVDFKKDSPFAYRQFSDVEPYSGLVRRDVLGDPGKYYDYTVSAGGKSKDPGGVVNP
ncbi:MAG: hypothetical protein DMG32_15250 [Acidobacteria bacterium]|nr:MAG: hypothetical protein DMG32_15250 [Acidobacteriota bacterium]